MNAVAIPYSRRNEREERVAASHASRIVAPSGLRRLLPDIPTALIAAAALGLYIWVSYWLKYRLHYNIGDSVARSADAVYVAVGRDPHLGAIGFYWPPVHSFLQIPFVITLKPFGQMEMAGPFVSSMATAGTILVLGHIGRFLRVNRISLSLLLLVFALNPLIIFYAANGMSEATSYFFISLAAYAFLRYCRSRRSIDMAFLGATLAIVPMVRIEAIAMAGIIAVIAAFRWGEWWQSLVRAIMLFAPAAYVFALWLGVQWILLGDPLYFLHIAGNQNGHLAATAAQAGASGGSSLTAYLVPPANDHRAVAIWVLKYFWFFGPAIGLLILGAIRHPLRSSREALGLLMFGGTYALVQVYLRFKGQGFNDPRYFTPIAISGILAAIWVVAEAGRTRRAVGSVRWLIRTGSITIATLAAGGLMALAAYNSTVAEANVNRARVVQEYIFFGRFLGQKYDTGNPNQWIAWHELDRTLDPLLAQGGEVICDAGHAFAADLYSRHPNKFIVINDRDWQKISADPSGHFQYVITYQSPTQLDQTPQDAVAGFLTPPENWKLITAVPEGANQQAGAIYLYGYAGSPGTKGPPVGPGSPPGP